MYSNEKRKCKRVTPNNASISLRPLDPQLWYRFWGGTDCALYDISFVGAGVYSTEPLPEGGCLSIDLKLKENIKNIVVFAKIIWVKKEAENRYRAGVSFSWWRDYQDKYTLNDFIEQQSLSN